MKESAKPDTEVKKFQDRINALLSELRYVRTIYRQIREILEARAKQPDVIKKYDTFFLRPLLA